MSMKKIIEMACNESIMGYLEEIAEINSNMNSKTQYEQQTSRKEMRKLAQYIIEELN